MVGAAVVVVVVVVAVAIAKATRAPRAEKPARAPTMPAKQSQPPPEP